MALAAKGDLPAQYNLGVTFADGVGVQQDLHEAAKWWTLAAEQGHAQAQYNLGHCYAEGELGQPDAKEAIKWLGRAAENGFAEGQFALGLIYHVGKLVDQNIEEALLWYQKAGEQGYSKALFNMGHIYSQEGANFDPFKSYFSFGLAREMGAQQAEERLDELCSSMTLEQIEQAKASIEDVMANARKLHSP